MEDRPFVVNVADAQHIVNERSAGWIEFEPEGVRWPDTGVRVTILQPGRPNGKYHRESVQEDFLVLAGECLVLLDGEERRLRAWDFVHCPAGVDHIFVGLEEPCAVLMIGARREGRRIHYPVSELAARHGASASRPMDAGVDDVYADWPEPDEPASFPWPLG